MVMTYAAQVRSVSKGVPPQNMQDNFYDLNSLRIICKYFVGSIVKVKTAEDEFEGVLNTISNNKICLSLVTTAKYENPDKILDMSAAKVINLDDVMCISTNNSVYNDVEVKGSFMKDATVLENCKNNKKLSINKNINEKHLENSIINSDNSDHLKDVSVKLENSSNIDSNDKDSVQTTKNNQDGKNKKTFTFNPNAPEFKPRCSTTTVSFSDNVGNNSNNTNGSPLIYSAAPLTPNSHFSPVFPPTSAPAIFVPNVFIFAPNQIGGTPNPGIHSPNINVSIDSTNNCSNNPNIDVRFPSGGVPVPMPEFSVPTTGLPFTPIMPFLSQTVPIFIPKHQITINSPPINTSNTINDTSSNTSESTPPVSSSSTAVVEQPTETNDLSNPSNWPPLQRNSNSSNNQAQSNVDKSSYNNICNSAKAQS